MSNKRTQLMLIGLLFMFAAFVIDKAWTAFIDDPQKKAEARLGNLEQNLSETKVSLANARRVAKKLTAYRGRSLPGDLDGARTLYQGWLQGLLTEAGLENQHIDSGAPLPREGITVLPFTVRGSASLGRVVQLLKEFYAADQLHQIRSLILTPRSEGSTIDLSLTIEALVVEGVDSNDKLPSLASDQLAYSAAEEYQLIGRRNWFSTSSAGDPALATFLSGVVQIDGRPQAWFTNRQQQSIERLFPGDTLDVGSVIGRVEKIDADSVTLRIGNERRKVRLRHNIAGTPATMGSDDPS